MSSIANMGAHPQFGAGSLRAQLPDVKQLFLTGQYRLCAGAAQALLRETTKDEPHIHVAYLHFYSGISYHEISRNMHMLNDQRQTSLENAEWHYTAAIAALSVLIDLTAPELETIREVSDHSEDEDSMEVSRNPSSRSSINRKRSSLDSNATDSSSVYSDEESEAAGPQTPKSSFRSPPSRNFLDDPVLSSQKSYRQSSFSSASNPQMERCNVQLTGVVNLMHSHIDDCHSLQDSHRTATITQSVSQGWHTIENSTLGHRYSETAKSSPKSPQALRGRAKLLPRQRFDPRKYEELCRKALAEF